VCKISPSATTEQLIKAPPCTGNRPRGKKKKPTLGAAPHHLPKYTTLSPHRAARLRRVQTMEKTVCRGKFPLEQRIPGQIALSPGTPPPTARDERTRGRVRSLAAWFSSTDHKVPSGKCYPDHLRSGVFSIAGSWPGHIRLQLLGP